MTKGLPASGKSTWAKEQCKKGFKRVNKDDMRDMLDNGIWSKSNEKLIINMRNEFVAYLLEEDYNVIVDDTNLHPKHEDALRELAEQFGAKFEIKSFLGVPIKECIKRDLNRDNSVGERVIRTMFNQFLKPKVAQYQHRDFLPYAIICDIDGTLAHMGGRLPYDHTKVIEDSLDETVKDIIDHYVDEVDIIIVSGRKDECKEDTVEWLKKHGIEYSELYMRKADDNRNDSIVKNEIFDTYIRDKYNVLFVLDDRNRVVEMWRDLGLKVLQVADGDF